MYLLILFVFSLGNRLLSKSPDCKSYPFQILILEGKAKDVDVDKFLEIGDYIGNSQRISLAKNAYMVLVDCDGQYFEFNHEARIDIKNIYFRKEKYSKMNRPNFGLCLADDRLVNKGIIIEYNSPIFLYHPKPYEHLTKVSNNSKICIRWVNASSNAQKEKYIIIIKDLDNKVIMSRTIDTTYFEFDRSYFPSGQTFFLVEISTTQSKDYPSSKAFFFDSNPSSRVYICDSQSPIDDLIIGFYLESNGFAESAREFYQSAAKNGGEHHTFQLMFDKFNIRNQ